MDFNKEGVGHHTHTHTHARFPASDLKQECGGLPCALVQAVGFGITLSVAAGHREGTLANKEDNCCKCPGGHPGVQSTHPPKMGTGKGHSRAPTFLCHSAQQRSPLPGQPQNTLLALSTRSTLFLGLLISALSPMLCGASVAAEEILECSLCACSYLS